MSGRVSVGKSKEKDDGEQRECNYYISKYEVMEGIIAKKKSKSITSS